MILINNPDKSVWAELLKRPMMNTESLHETVRNILNQIKNEGDEAVLRYEETFDHVRLESLVVTEEEIQEAESLVSDELKQHCTIPRGTTFWGCAGGNPTWCCVLATICAH